MSREVNHYNLQAIIAVGLKVNNERAVQFRKWANAIVKDYTIQGWVMDNERLKKGGTTLTEEYFEKLLERVRERWPKPTRRPNSRSSASGRRALPKRFRPLRRAGRTCA